MSRYYCEHSACIINFRNFRQPALLPPASIPPRGWRRNPSMNSVPSLHSRGTANRRQILANCDTIANCDSSFCKTPIGVGKSGKLFGWGQPHWFSACRGGMSSKYKRFSSDPAWRRLHIHILVRFLPPVYGTPFWIFDRMDAEELFC